jgi:hypothetical protein
MATFFNLARRNFGGLTEFPSTDEAAEEFVRIFLEGVQNGRDRR